MKRVYAIDYLKTFAIIGVLLFHIGLSDNGYLGVEVFFVVSGFLMIGGITRSAAENKFHPVKYIVGKVATFWLLIAVAGLLSIGIGYLCMLPDDYENLAESVIASNFFSNNILQAITTSNYWDIGNAYKPLMQTWYIGVLLQTIVFLSIVLWVAAKVSKKNGIRNTLIFLTVVSFLAYCLPFVPAAYKFYFFPFRLFEITVGCLIPFLPKSRLSPKALSLIGNLGILVILFGMFAGIAFPGVVALPIVVLASALVLWSHGGINEDYGIGEKIYKIVTAPGRYSYDVYIWHQVVIAFLYYSVFQTVNAAMVCAVVGVTAVLSVASITIRKKIPLLNGVWKRIIVAAVAVLLGCALSAYVYLVAGVVRNVPELGIEKANVHRNMHAEYVDTPYSWNNDFKDDQRIHVLVLGNSFGRDFANILNESEYADRIEISYLYDSDTSNERDRVEQADFVFYGSNNWDIPATLDDIPSEKLYIVGNKSFGNSNGIFYANRNKDGYFEQRAAVPEEMLLHNDAMKGAFGDHYIDMISPLLDSEKNIRIFTDNGCFISQDCRHLTKQGAQYYAKILDLSFLIEKES